jgi:hypothetical protein
MTHRLEFAQSVLPTGKSVTDKLPCGNDGKQKATSKVAFDSPGCVEYYPKHVVTAQAGTPV